MRVAICTRSALHLLFVSGIVICLASLQEADGSALNRLLAGHAAYLAESLGCVPMLLAHKPPAAVVLARERQTVGSDSSSIAFDAVLASPAVACSGAALLDACGGSAPLADSAALYLASRCPSALQAECAKAQGAVRVRLDGKDLALQAGKHFFFSAGKRAASGVQP